MLLNCPKCAAPMEPVSHQDITVDRCTSCQGLWFDLMEQRRLKERAGSEAIDTGDPAKGQTMNQRVQVACPRCHTPMVHMRDVDQREIEYEYCAVCNGAFFDAGEFTRYKHPGFLATIRNWVHHPH